MNFDFDDANINPISKEEILYKISEYDIFKKYIHNFIELDVSFMSELRNTDTANCRITDKYNSLIYKDFKSGDSYDCWNYIMKKYYCSFHESLNIVATDFNIRKLEYKNEIIPIGILPNSIKLNYTAKKEKSKLIITKQNWNIIDYNFWSQYEIDFNTLDFYNVVSAKYTFLIKNNLRYCFNYSKVKPRYAYLFDNSTKAYSPYEDKVGKWMYDGDSDNIEGWNQLDETGDYIILTKGLKDVMDYHKLDINAIALPSENSVFKENLIRNILERFDKIIINLDNDTQGVISTNKIINQYSFDHFYIDEHKDLSDWIKNNSLEQAKIMIKNKINSLNNG